jgi:hypothetical protein
MLALRNFHKVGEGRKPGQLQNLSTIYIKTNVVWFLILEGTFGPPSNLNFKFF